ncbi:MAG: UDP-glucose 4-epimerase GalE [Thiotrichaceae bacterium]|nr:UDP-glucose 4-epimerase GalE [Thiotrichaceae bacterium]
MAQQGILVTGGAGYIGSHVVRQLGEAGHRIVVLDNLSTGFRESVLHGELIIGNSGDQPLVSQILKDHEIGAVLHFAANIVVPESVSDPMKYYGNNTCNTRNLLDCCQKAGVAHFIFSSTAAVYGIPDELPASEETPLVPINPYGSSKLMSEWMLRDLAAACDLNYVVLRYFNVAGANVEGQIGQSTPEATHLIKVACEVATGAREQVAIFGTDYPTEDGTGVRDYIHVDDLASAHLKALDYLRTGGESTTLNCGYGSGFSVRQVLNAVEKCHGSPIKIVEEPRRAGDPPALIAAASKIRETLGWQPKYNDLGLITQTALDWEKKVQAKKKSA